jgi:hypothetical protein
MYHNRINLIVAILIRHLVAPIVSITAAILLVTVVYFALLVVAIASNSGLGGLIALPFWAVAAGILSLFLTACLLFPAVPIAELISQRLRSHQIFTSALISTIALVALVYTLTSGVRLLFNNAKFPLFQFANYPLQIFLALCLPLGLYWWTTKATQASVTGIIGLCKRMFGNAEAN